MYNILHEKYTLGKFIPSQQELKNIRYEKDYIVTFNVSINRSTYCSYKKLRIPS